MSNFDYPLQDEQSKFDYKLVNSNGKLSEVPLHTKYQKLSLLESRNIQAEISSHPCSTVDEKRENRRKRNAREDDPREFECFVSCDEMTSSDTDSNTQVSSTQAQAQIQAQTHSYCTNALAHPPSKKRLTSNSNHSGGVSTSGVQADPANLSSSNIFGGSTTATTTTTTATSTTTTTTSTTSGGSGGGNGGVGTHNQTTSNLSRDHNRRPKTPTQMNSPSHTPVSDVEEEDQIQQLPLPSPSASPAQSDHENDMSSVPDTPHEMIRKSNLNLLESHMAAVPNTQGELINLINYLSKFLTPENQNHIIFRFLQNTNRSTLSTFNGLIHNCLKRDLIGNFPFEIATKVLSHLDHKTLLSLGLVCKRWFSIINNSELWIRLLKKDKLITHEAAIKEELSQSDTLISQWCTLPDRINPAQVLYKKRKIIVNRWLDPKYKPKRISVTGHGNKVVTCLQHDEEKIVTGVDDKCILIYSTKTGQLLKVLDGHEGGVWALKYRGNTLVTGSTDRTVRVWNMTTGKCTHIFRGHTSTIRCLDIIEPTVIGKDANGSDIIFPEYPLLVTGSRDHNIHVWRLPILSDDDSEGPVFDGGEMDNPYLIAVLSGHTQSVRSISGCGNIIISGSYDSTVRVWDLLDSGNCKHILQGHQDRVYSTAIDFKRNVCFSGSMDSTINVWNFETGELLKILEGHSSLVGLLALVDDVLVSAAADASLRIWDPVTGELRSKLKGHAAAITCFEHDGLKVVSGSEKMLKLWDVEKGVFARDLLNDVTGGIWQVRIDHKRCVAAVQRFNSDDEGETFIEILDFSEPPKLRDQTENLLLYNQIT
ncbi:CDC4 [Candida oxycetoniae]|uniref:CDC4 n=1 Tax=Candida oxycetoniae TaxID=497107 RepID=A0AAI9SXB7_9ASCO|nr:CDC4 [Candida oxycetoniae]KAI3404823.2 CDC4 [Candida oxycetoniae]